jgi:hypothetical protein
MLVSPPPFAPRTWFFRSAAITLVVGACLLLLIAVRPGYGALWLTSTLACLVAGFLWSLSTPFHRARHGQSVRYTPTSTELLRVARSYRISAAFSESPGARPDHHPPILLRDTDPPPAKLQTPDPSIINCSSSNYSAC